MYLLMNTLNVVCKPLFKSVTDIDCLVNTYEDTVEIIYKEKGNYNDFISWSHQISINDFVLLQNWYFWKNTF